MGLYFLSSSCISDIEFEVPGTVQNAVAIQAKVVKGTPNIINVEVQNAVDFTGLSAAIRVRDVILTNLSSGQRIEIPNNGSNSYLLEIEEDSPEMSINYNDEYSLQVTTFDGAILETTGEKLLAVPKPESLSFELVEVEDGAPRGARDITEGLRFYLNTPTRNQFGALTSMRWSFEHTYIATDFPLNPNIERKACFISENLGATTEVSYNPKILGEERLNQFELFDQNITPAHGEGNYFTAIQHSLSDGAFEYFNQINDLISRDGSIFDPPAGIIETNFKNTSEVEQQVFGYFYLTEIDTVRVFINPDAVGNPRPFCTPIPPSDSDTPNVPDLSIRQICADCLDVNRSTLNKPSWWVN